MTVKVGDRVPSVTLRYVTPDGVQAVGDRRISFAAKR